MAIFVPTRPYKTGNGYHKHDRLLSPQPPPGVRAPEHVIPTPSATNGGYGRKNGLYTKGSGEGGPLR